ncbi:MAG: SAM-dependent methyltransferase [Rhizobiales bacterium]|mgnify:CR=1 FL=1|nr:SAM-dependent methyltransferase [Hyphomicrobiales bacterium]OJY44850.1 MAG: SAM-dependent methyltransferase [Rhizobiales bacterium 64-17]
MRADLPAELTAALARESHGLSRSDAARRADVMSQTYRGGGGSAVIADPRDALAYALVRMPATFAAVAACLDAVAAARPDFAPQSLIDAGAGPGTATWAARAAFSTLQTLSMLDANPALRDLAQRLAAASPVMRDATYRLGDAATGLGALAAADLTVASYVIAELDAPAAARLVERLWEKTAGVLLLVEPGTPDGTRRVLAARAHLIAAGAHVLAPCPHAAPCPMAEPAWCHFAQRLARSRDHLRIKQADVPYEDEKFSYLAVSRQPAVTRDSWVVATPRLSKAAVALRLCTPAGQLAEVAVPRRDKPAYAAARRLRWGDTTTAGLTPNGFQK